MGIMIRAASVAAAMMMMGSFAGANTASSPVSIVSGPAALFFHNQILYSEGDTVVVRSPVASDGSFKDLYVVKTPFWFGNLDVVETYGEVLDFAPGKFAVMRVAPQQVGPLSGDLHHRGLACGVLFKLNGDTMPGIKAEVPVPLVPIDLRDGRVAEVTTEVVADNIKQTIMDLAEIDTRFHTTPTGRGVAAFLVERYEALKGKRSDVTITEYQHSDTDQNSIVVRIEGQTRPSEVLVLGSHIDSVNWRNGSESRAPGADDNASGTATNLEVFRVLMEREIKLDRTLEIHGYAAEEIGLVGSQEIARAYRNEGINVIAMMQIDMNLFNPQGTEDMIHLVTSNTLGGFNDQLTQLVGHYAGVPVTSAPLYGGSSDHASWTRQGFAAAFPFENPSSYNRQIHTAGDTIENSGRFGQAAAFAKLGLAYVLHFGGLNN